MKNIIISFLHLLFLSCSNTNSQKNFYQTCNSAGECGTSLEYDTILNLNPNAISCNDIFGTLQHAYNELNEMDKSCNNDNDCVLISGPSPYCNQGTALSRDIYTSAHENIYEALFAKAQVCYISNGEPVYCPSAAVSAKCKMKSCEAIFDVSE